MKRSIKILTATLIFIFLGASTYLCINAVNSKQLEEIEISNKEINRKTADSLNQYFQNLVNNTTVFLDAASKIKSSKDSYDSYNKFLKYNPDVLFIGNSRGWYYYNTEYPFSSELDDKINSWLLTVDSACGIYDMREVVNQFALACVFKYDSDSKTGVSAFNTGTVSKILRNSSSNKSFVTDSNSNLLIAPDVNIKKQKIPSTAAKIISKMEKENLEEYKDFITINTTKFVINASKIQRGLYVITTVSENSINHRITLTAFKIYLMLFILYVIVILLLLITHRKKETEHEIQKTVEKPEPEIIKAGTAISVVLCSDILSYSSIIRKMKAEDIIAFSNEYLQEMTQCVEKTGGLVNETSSNKITASWTVQNDSPETSHAQQAINAVASALMMRVALFKLNRLRVQNGQETIRCGCAVTSGVIVSGKIGGTQNIPSIIGEPVKAAEKIKELNRKYSTDIIITQNIYELTGTNIIAQEIPGAFYNSQKLYIVINLKNKKIPSDLKTLRQILTAGV